MAIFDRLGCETGLIPTVVDPFAWPLLMARHQASGMRRVGALLQQSREPVFVLDAALRFLFVNKSWEELTGRSMREIAHLECRPTGPTLKNDLESLAASFCPPAEAQAGQVCGGNVLVVHASGERLWRRIDYWPLSKGGGHPFGVLGLVRPLDAAGSSPESATQQLRAQLIQLREDLQARNGTVSLIGDGFAHRRVMEQVETAVSSRRPLVVVGEPGTGKHTVARVIHDRGPFSQAPCLIFDVSALPPEALRRALFGDTRSTEGSNSTLDLPQGATAVIGDLAELARDLQAELASPFQGQSLASAPRLVFLSTVEPEELMRIDRLRADLYYAITGLTIRLAPLRGRLDELPLLAQHFLDRANQRGDRRKLALAPDAIAGLRVYDWPGNLRELAHVIDAAFASAAGDLITAADLPADVRGHLASAYNPPPMPPPVTPLDTTLERVERRLIEQALHWARHNKSKAAEYLTISRPRLYRRMKDLGIPDLPEPKENATGGSTPVSLWLDPPRT